MEFRTFLKNHYPVLLAALALQLLFLALAYHFKSLYLTDSAEYFYQAENIKNHGSLYCWKWEKPFILQNWTLRTPVYGYLIFLLQKLSASHFAVILFQNLLAFINFTGLVWLLKEVKLPKRYLYGFLFLSLSFFPTRLVYTNMIMSELVLETFLFWAFFLLVQFVRNKNPRLIIGFNFLLSLAVLTKPVLVYFWLPNLAFMLWLAWKKRQPTLALSGFIMPIAIFTLCFYNQQVTGYFHFSSIKTYNLYDYNTKGLLANLFDQDYANKTIQEIIKTDQDFAGLKERTEFIEAKCYEIIKENLGYYSWLHLRGTINFYLDPGRYDLVNFLPPLQTKKEFSFFGTLREQGIAGIGTYLAKIPLGLTLYLILNFLMNLITTGGLIIFAFNRKFSLVLQIFVPLLVVYISAASGPIGCSRFKEPVYFLIVFATVKVFEYFWLKKKANQKKVQEPAFVFKVR
jgi:hypothetical protein